MRTFISENKFILLAIFLTAALGSLAWFIHSLKPQAQMVELKTIGAPQIGGDFEMIDQDGNAFTQEKLVGKHSLIFFGFTHCPDICPTGLTLLTDVKNRLTPDQQARLQTIFVTIDPERDTAPVLKQYLSHFDTEIVGLTGSKQQLKKMADAYLVYYARNPDSDPNFYLMDHSAYVYVMDENGNFITHFAHHEAAEKMAASISNILK